MSERPPRFFVPDLAEAPGTVALAPAEAHHAARVLRLKAGAAVELFDGRGRRATARLAEVGRRRVTAEIERAWAEPPPAGPRIHLATAVPKGSRADWLVEKATELGAASLVPVLFERSVGGKAALSPAKGRRWLAQAVAAAKQSGADLLPEVRPSARLEEVLEAAAGGLILVGDPGEDAHPVPEALARRRPEQDIWILVGPEGGLTAPERQALRATGAVPVRLGRSVLRVETAAMALLAAVAAFA
jgi:16S rRNA (uracil1498-N3)-methyltransferase